MTKPAVIIVFLATVGCSMHQDRHTVTPAYMVGDCFRYTAPERQEWGGQVLDVSERQYYVEIKAKNSSSSVYADLIPVSSLEKISYPVACANGTTGTHAVPGNGVPNSTHQETK